MQRIDHIMVFYLLPFDKIVLFKCSSMYLTFKNLKKHAPYFFTKAQLYFHPSPLPQEANLGKGRWVNDWPPSPSVSWRCCDRPALVAAAPLERSPWLEKAVSTGAVGNPEVLAEGRWVSKQR